MIFIVKKIQTGAKEVKAQMVEAGIEVLKCRQDKLGVNISIDYTDENVSKFVEFCDKNGLKRTHNQRKLYSVASIRGEFMDFGTLFKFEQ